MGFSEKSEDWDYRGTIVEFGRKAWVIHYRAKSQNHFINKIEEAKQEADFPGSWIERVKEKNGVEIFVQESPSGGLPAHKLR